MPADAHVVKTTDPEVNPWPWVLKAIVVVTGVTAFLLGIVTLLLFVS